MGLNIEKKEKCPLCGSKKTRWDLDYPGTLKVCDHCGSEWTKDGDITFDGYNDEVEPTDENSYMCQNCGGGFSREEMVFAPDNPTDDEYESDFCKYCIDPHNQNINEVKNMETGKLKLLEILTPDDISQIKSLANTEANKVVKEKLTPVEKNLQKHSQDKDSHMKTSDVKNVIKPEVDKVKQELNTKIDDKVTKVEQTMEDKIKKITNGKEFDTKIKELVADTMVKYHQTLWAKRGFWTSGLTK